MTILIKESVAGLRNGHTTVGTTPVQLIDHELPWNPNKGVLIRCPGADDPTPNTVPVWVGGGKFVTADSDVSSGGMPILPGESLFVPVEDPRKLWLISTAASQDAAWLVI